MSKWDINIPGATFLPTCGKHEAVQTYLMASLIEKDMEQIRQMIREEVHKALHPEQENTFEDVSNEQIVSAGMPIHQPYEYCCPLHYPMPERKKI